MGNTTLTLPQDPPQSGYGLVEAFPNVFQQPVGIVSAPGDTNRLFIVERKGLIQVIENLDQPSLTTFLDLRNDTDFTDMESGLLGLAFHPQYASNGLFYVFRTLITSSPAGNNTLHDQLSRFSVSTNDPNKADVTSEVPVLVQRDLGFHHNAGDLHFGPDGYLYISLGDSTPPPQDRSPSTLQPIDRGFFAGILRIDVDKRPGSLPPNPHPAVTAEYAIPSDNPFIGMTNYQGVAVNPAEVRTEYFAIGMRNPWRFAIHPVTGMIIACDVGADSYEEINQVSMGGNYGWPYLEGPVPTSSLIHQAPSGFSGIPPLVFLTHGNATNQGKALVGGVFYTGSTIPQLTGAYLFGDFRRGHIWMLRPDTVTSPDDYVRLTGMPELSCFGTDPRNGDVLVANFGTGKIRRLVYTDPGQAPTFPQTLAETGAFADLLTLEPQAGIIPYDLNLPFWSDNAIKTRWFSLPDPSQQMAFSENGNWLFPTGSVWIKHFDLEMTKGDPATARRLETRFVVRNRLGVYGVTYRWLTNGTTELVPEAGLDELFMINDNGVVREQVWHYPGRAECAACHNHIAGWSLGFTTAQLNRHVDYGQGPRDQILELARAGYIQTNIVSSVQLRKLVPLDDAQSSVYDRVKSYFEANCAFCHQPSTFNAFWDARLNTRLESMGLLNDKLVTPRSVENSFLINRLSTHGRIRMPPIASSVIDTNGVELIKQWILSLPVTPWSTHDVGRPKREGSVGVDSGQLTIAGSGNQLASTCDEFRLLHQPFEENILLTARLQAQFSPGYLGQAGLMIRAGTETNAPFLFAGIRPDQRPVARFRSLPGQFGSLAGLETNPPVEWVQLKKEGGRVQARFSPDAVNWIESQPIEVELPFQFRGGLAISSGSSLQVNMATFDNFQSIAPHLTCPDLSASQSLGDALTLVGEPNARDAGIVGAEFFVNGNKVGERNEPPYYVIYTPLTSGTHRVVVQFSDTMGSTIEAPPVDLNVGLPPASASFGGTDATGGGNWFPRFGQVGYLVVNGETNLPPHITVTSTASTVTWDHPTTDPRGLLKPTVGNRIGAALTGSDTLDVAITAESGDWYQLTAYCVDWDTGNERQQEVEVVESSTGTVLDTRVASSFGEGVYLTWIVRGAVELRFRGLAGSEPVVSGLFVDLDPFEPPVLGIFSPTNDTTLVLPTNLNVNIKAFGINQVITGVELLLNGRPLESDVTPPYVINWEPTQTGTFLLQARATNSLGRVAYSQPVHVNATVRRATAEYLGMDEATQGNWIGTYGNDGAVISGIGTNSPGYVSLDTSGLNESIWASSTTDPRAPSTFDGLNRMASTYVSRQSLTFRFAYLDEQFHRVSLYLLDWDSNLRRARIDVLASATGELLDSHEIAEFNQGAYLTWNLQGDVQIRVTSLNGNAVTTGIFFDSPTLTYATWGLSYFSLDELDDPDVGGQNADPDGDGIINVREYLHGQHPRVNDANGFPRAQIIDGYFVYEYIRLKQTADLKLAVQYSEDLINWVTGSAEVETRMLIDDGATERVRVRIATPVAGLPKGFLRLKVMTP